MHAPHRLADPITAILSFTGSAPVDLRQLTRVEPRPQATNASGPSAPRDPVRPRTCREGARNA
jgi:hypothetical protein